MDAAAVAPITMPSSPSALAAAPSPVEVPPSTPTIGSPIAPPFLTLTPVAEPGALSTNSAMGINQAVDEENLGRFWSSSPPLFSFQALVPGVLPSTTPACLPYPTIGTTWNDLPWNGEEGLNPGLTLCTPDVPNYDDSRWYDPARKCWTRDECSNSFDVGALDWAGVFDPDTLPSFDLCLSSDGPNNMDNGLLVGPGYHSEDFLADAGGEETLALDVNNSISASDRGLHFSRTFVPEGAIFPLSQIHVDDDSFLAAFQSDEGPLTNTMEETAPGTGDELSPGFDDNNFPFTSTGMDEDIDFGVSFPYEDFSDMY
ncbi:MAG: hypothetical protein L6R41_006747 [Letrouitia leprolyta]|nr:MAG: hypothetical protein L6R41_006747 [Letrouitia leprolyta]